MDETADMKMDGIEGITIELIGKNKRTEFFKYFEYFLKISQDETRAMQSKNSGTFNKIITNNASANYLIRSLWRSAKLVHPQILSILRNCTVFYSVCTYSHNSDSSI